MSCVLCCVPYSYSSVREEGPPAGDRNSSYDNPNVFNDAEAVSFLVPAVSFFQVKYLNQRLHAYYTGMQLRSHALVA